MNKRFIILFVLMLSFWAIIISSSTAGNTPDIRGVWYPDLYILKDGTKPIVKGLIFFGEKDWLVLFFVVNENQKPLLGSAEGGVYSLNENRLVLKHLYNLSGGKEVAGSPIKPSNMEIKDILNARVEPCTVEIKSDILTMDFPSGNRMTFKSPTAGAHIAVEDLLSRPMIPSATR